MAVPLHLFLDHHKHHCNSPKKNVMAQPFHVLCSTNAMHWRPRCFNDDIGWAVQRSDFDQMSWWSRFFRSCNVSKTCILYCVVEQHLSSCKDLRHLYDSENNIWLCFPPSHVTFDVYFDCFGVWHHNLILMTFFVQQVLFFTVEWPKPMQWYITHDITHDSFGCRAHFCSALLPNTFKNQRKSQTL